MSESGPNSLNYSKNRAEAGAEIGAKKHEYKERGEKIVGIAKEKEYNIQKAKIGATIAEIAKRQGIEDFDPTNKNQVKQVISEFLMNTCGIDDFDINNQEHRKYAMEVLGTMQEGRKLDRQEGRKPDKQDNRESDVQHDKIEKSKVDPNKLKNNKGLKKFFIRAGALALAMGLAAGLFLARNNNKKSGGNVPSSALEEIQEDTEQGDNSSEFEEAEIGIKDGYGEKGMWLSENKSGPYDFASATEVAEACDNDEVEMIKYTAHNQVESFADYLANLPERLQPEGFKGLSIIETEAKLESLSDEDFAKVQQHFDGVMDQAFTRRVTLNGEYENSYMRKKDANGDAVHGNMELVGCSTNENGIVVNEFYWPDNQGGEIGTMDVKIIYGEDGNIVKGCNQAVNKKGAKPILYSGMAIVVEQTTPPTSQVEQPGEKGSPTPTPTPETPAPTPETPTPTPETPTPTPETPTPTPETPTPEPKNLEAEQKNAGDVVTPLELNEEVTPPTTIEQDQANFEAIQQQQAEDQARAEEAARVAAEQAAREQAAAAEAEQRRQAEEAARQAELAQMQEAERQQREAAEAEAQRAAEEAARAAAEQAAREQAAAAEAERARAAEEAARQQAQQEADNQAQANSEAATANEDATAEQRAEMFADGDF